MTLTTPRGCRAPGLVIATCALMTSACALFHAEPNAGPAHPRPAAAAEGPGVTQARSSSDDTSPEAGQLDAGAGPVPPAEIPNPPPAADEPTHGEDAPAPAALEEQQGQPEPDTERPPAGDTQAAPDPKDVEAAGQLLAEGLRLFALSRYPEAEEQVRRALARYPFVPGANLALGKLFLLRGYAALDRDLVASAQLMFRMALELDPDDAQARILLDLFEQREAGP